jgi:hypothetical protein
VEVAAGAVVVLLGLLFFYKAINARRSGKTRSDRVIFSILGFVMVGGGILWVLGLIG